MKNTHKAIIIGASSGIGEALAYTLGKNGYSLGLMARRVTAIQEIANKIPMDTYIKFIDLTEPDQAIQNFKDLVEEMRGVDLVIINSGVITQNPELNWEKEKETIAVNVVGFTAIASTAMKYFIEQGYGHLVGISSLTALKSFPPFCAYCASKAYISNYLQGLQANVMREGYAITVTDIKPGFIDTEMVKDLDTTFWMTSASVAAEQIYEAIKKHKKHAYITKRWRFIAWLLKTLPDCILHRLYCL